MQSRKSGIYYSFTFLAVDATRAAMAGTKLDPELSVRHSRTGMLHLYEVHADLMTYHIACLCDFCYSWISYGGGGCRYYIGIGSWWCRYAIPICRLN
jgi:hypothetical protein